MGEKFDVLVIGGGLAGLSCGCELSDAGLKVLVLERSRYLGGRASSFYYKGREIDIGQHVFLRCCSEYQRFLRRIGAWANMYLQPSFELPVWRDGRLGVLRSAKLPAPLHLLPSILKFPHLVWGDKLRVLYGALCIKKARSSYEGETFYSWLKRHAQSEKAIQDFWNLIILAATGAEVREAACQWGLMVFQEALMKAHGADFGYGLIGLSRLLEGVFSYLEGRGSRVMLGKAARSLLIEGDRVRGVVLPLGEVLCADHYVSAVASHDLLRLLPPGWRAHPFFARAAHLRWAPIVNIHLFYDREVTRQKISAFLGSPVQWLFNRSLMLAEAGPGQHLCISLSGAWEYIDKDPKALISFFSSEMRRLLPKIKSARLEDFLVIKQRNATFLPAPFSSRYRLPQRTPIENLFLAGDWTRTGWPATMEGAVRSGLLSAQEILGVILNDSGASCR